MRGLSERSCTQRVCPRNLLPVPKRRIFAILFGGLSPCRKLLGDNRREVCRSSRETGLKEPSLKNMPRTFAQIGVRDPGLGLRTRHVTTCHLGFVNDALQTSSDKKESDKSLRMGRISFEITQHLCHCQSITDPAHGKLYYPSVGDVPFKVHLHKPPLVFPEGVPRPGPARLRRPGLRHLATSDVLTEGLWPGMPIPAAAKSPESSSRSAMFPSSETGQRVGLGLGGHCSLPARTLPPREASSSARTAQILNPHPTEATPTTSSPQPMPSPSARWSLPPVRPARPMCARVPNSTPSATATCPPTTPSPSSISGLGHLAVVRPSPASSHRRHRRRKRKRQSGARQQLGAHVYIDNQNQDPAAELQSSVAPKSFSPPSPPPTVKPVLAGLQGTRQADHRRHPRAPPVLTINAILVVGERSSPVRPSRNRHGLQGCSTSSTGCPQTRSSPSKKQLEKLRRMMSGKAASAAVTHHGA